MITFDKSEIKSQLTIDDIFELLQEWGGDPVLTPFGIVSNTICHNKPGEGSRKLYFYQNSELFRCYTGCDSTFDIFDLTIKVINIQKGLQWDLNDAVRFVASRFGITGNQIDDKTSQLEDWEILANYNRIQDIQAQDYNITLKDYDNFILNNFNYQVKITPWLKEGISQEAINKAGVGFYPGGDQITIPHFDPNNRFIGLRGRTLCEQDAEYFGKYRPLKVNGLLYTHPLGMNLYGLNWAKDNITVLKRAIIFESEKAVLLFMSYFGADNNVAVACCGSNISTFQIHQLLNLGVEEIIIAFDRQFQEIGDSEYKHLTDNLLKTAKKYSKYATISCIFDKNKITSYKASPIDEGKEKFLQLFKERIVL